MPTSIYFYRNRYYMSGCMRFISEDPIGWASGQTNNYAYVGGNPIQLRDPSGEIAPLVITAALGAAFAALGDAAWQGISIANDGGCFNWGDVGKAAVIGGIAGAALPIAAELGTGLAGAALIGGVSNLAAYKWMGGTWDGNGPLWAYGTGLLGGLIGGQAAAANRYGGGSTAGGWGMAQQVNRDIANNANTSLGSVVRGAGSGFASSTPSSLGGDGSGGSCGN